MDRSLVYTRFPYSFQKASGVSMRVAAGSLLSLKHNSTLVSHGLMRRGSDLRDSPRPQSICSAPETSERKLLPRTALPVRCA